MTEWEVPWEGHGHIYVEADSEEEALEKASNKVMRGKGVVDGVSTERANEVED